LSQLPKAPWGKPWFYQKTFGYGTSLPCSWEGWVALAALLAVVIGWSVFANERLAGGFKNPIAPAVHVILLIGFVVLAWGRTSGGWRWRAGASD
jgi:hypothetical protein